MRAKPERIVVGVADGERSRDAVALARVLATATGARLVAASVHPSISALAGHPEPRDYESSWRDQASARLAEVEPLLADVGSHESRVVPGGSPASGLGRVAQEMGADLVVIGSTHRGIVGRVLAGSIAERLLNGGHRAVAVAPRGYGGGEHRLGVVGVAVDSSREAGSALDAAAALALAAGAELRVITVIEPVSPPPERTTGAHLDTEELTFQLVQFGQRRLDATLERLPDELTAEGLLLEGDPAQMVEGESERLDLLVTGSRGYGPVRSVLLGSVSLHLSRTSACPLLVVPRDEAELSAAA
jgi:nucleotide-binding universal stress UspA family protein